MCHFPCNNKTQRIVAHYQTTTCSGNMEETVVAFSAFIWSLSVESVCFCSFFQHFLFFSNVVIFPTYLLFSLPVWLQIYSLKEFKKICSYFLNNPSFPYSLLDYKIIHISGIRARLKPWTLAVKQMQNSAMMSMKSWHDMRSVSIR